MPIKQITVLFVDDDAGFLEVIRSLMRAYSEEMWEVLTATEAAQALGFLRERKIDLMVIDVHMPVMDGLQFLGLLNRRYPNLLKAVLTGNATEQYRAACLSNGAELFLEKPVTQEGWQGLFNALNELATFKPEEGFRGLLRRVGLQDVLQMECLARSSSVLDISTAETHGSIFVQEGQIIHAQVGELTGEEAFNRLMSLGGGEFNLTPFTEPPERTISGSWEFLLMEAMRKRDEAKEPELESSVLDAAAPAALPSEIESLVDQTTPAPAPLEMPAAAAPAAETVTEPFLPEAGAVPGPQPAEMLRPMIEEMLVCSTQGDVLYEWQCADANDRIRFLQFLSQKSWQLRQGLPIGYFQRLEIEGSKNRIVTRIDPDRALFVRVCRVPAETPS